MFRNLDFTAAHNRHGFNHRGVGFHVGFSQVDLEAAAERDQLSAAKSLRGAAFVEATKNRDVVQVGVVGTGAAPRVDVIHPLRTSGAVSATAAPAHRLINHQDAHADDRQGPNAVEPEVADAEIAQQKQRAPGEQNESPQPAHASAATAHQRHDASGDQHGRPEIIEHAVGGENALLVEQQDDARAQNQSAEQ